MAVAIFAAATLGVCASGRCRGLGAGRGRALTIHEPRAAIGRRRGGARQDPPSCFRSAAVARRRCGVCPEGIRVSDGVCSLQCGSYFSCSSRAPGGGGSLLSAWRGTPPARVLAPGFPFQPTPAAPPALFRPGVWPGREPARAA